MASRNRRSSKSELERVRRQRATLAEFGAHALGNDDLQALLQEATRRVSGAIEVDLVKVLQIMEDGRSLLIVAGVNWRPGVVGHATMAADESTPAGYALQHDAPVISHDLGKENRFVISELLVSHGVKSMINVVIRGKAGPFGVLEVDAREHRDFDEDDVNFLQSYAHLLAGAIDRLKTQRKLTEAADRNEVLARELQHRVKNILAIVRALSRQTVAQSNSLEEYSQAFEGRIEALARTQNLVALSPGGLINLRDLARDELKAHGAEDTDKIEVSGPDLLLPPRIAQVVGLVFHELSTNAMKYGALASASGRIALAWEERSGRIRVHWRETGVTISDTSPSPGVGFRIVTDSLPYMLDGTARLSFRHDGAECVLEFPVPPEEGDQNGGEQGHV
jgi:two-component sensor histidine kinase